MKKYIALIALFTLTSVICFTTGIIASPGIKLFVNGKEVITDIKLVDGNSYIPIHDVAEWLGKEDIWMDGEHNELHIGGEESSIAGKSYQNPAPIGTEVDFQKVTPFEKYHGSLHVDEIARGSKALNLMVNIVDLQRGVWIETTDPSKVDPEERELFLAKVTIKLTNISDNKFLQIKNDDFQLVSSTGKIYRPILETPPSPSIATKLLLGEQHTGWIIMQVDKNDKAPILEYGSVLVDGAWFKTNDY
ncbi:MULTISPECIES: hypothetical protein [unclassified Paenibacillus]|uniref:hypothetical protein n=1 Tax=unclassified Paenibacillus TaxID=185978 RepID=UPI0036317358